MTIQVYTHSEKDEKALLDFLESGHYDYKSTEESGMTDAEFLDEYNKEIEESEAQIQAGNYFTHDEVKNLLAEKRKLRGGN